MLLRIRAIQLLLTGRPLTNNLCNLLRLVAVDAVTNPWETMQVATFDFAVHEQCVGERCHSVLFAPEDVCGNMDLGEQGTRVFGGNVAERVFHHGACSFVVVYTDETVEQFLPKWLEGLQSFDL